MILVQDSTMLQGFRDGEATVLRDVYLHYAPQLYSYLRQGFSFTSGERWFRVPPVSDPAEQENLVQETFVRCFREQIRHNYDGKRPFLAYLQRTCRNLLLEERRRTRVALVEEDGSSEVSNDEDVVSPDLLMEHQELLSLLQDFLEHCSEREQRVFRAIYEEGDSQAQAAERLGLGRTQIRTSLQKLRQGLMQHLRESGYLQVLASTSPGTLLSMGWWFGPWAPLLAELLSS